MPSGRSFDSQTGNGAAWAFKGLCEFGLKNYVAALGDLNKAQGLGVGDPKLIPVARYHRAILLTRVEQYERAQQAYAEFGREGNGSPMVIEGMGVAVLRLAFLPDEVPAEQRDLVLLAGRAAFLSASDPDRSGAARLRGASEAVSADAARPLSVWCVLLRDRPDHRPWISSTRSCASLRITRSR